jgi:hypothetical protein
MKYAIFALLASLTMASAPAHAGEGGSGGIGGGEHVGKYLRDLVSEGTCVIQTGRSFAAKEAPLLKGILTKLEQTHWFFAEQLRAQIDDLRVCKVGGNLRRIRTNDANDFVYYKERSGLIAIRTYGEVEDYVFVDSGAFQSLNAESKAYLLIHEAMHAFIPAGADRRNQKVRNIVAAIRAAVKKPMSEEEFELQLQYSEVDTLARASEADSAHEAIRVFSDSQSTESERIAAYPAIMAETAFHDDQSDYKEWAYGKYLPTIFKAALEARDNDIDSLQRALATGDIQVADAAISRLGARALGAKAKDGEIAVLGAIRGQQVGMVRWLATRPNTETCLKITLIGCDHPINVDRYGTLIAKAVRTGNDELVEALLSLSQAKLSSLGEHRSFFPMTLADIASGRTPPSDLPLTAALFDGTPRMLQAILSHPSFSASAYGAQFGQNVGFKTLFTSDDIGQRADLDSYDRYPRYSVEQMEAHDKAMTSHLSWADVAILKHDPAKLALLTRAGFRCNLLCRHLGKGGELIQPKSNGRTNDNVIERCVGPHQLNLKAYLGYRCKTEKGAIVRFGFNERMGYGWFDPSGAFWPTTIAPRRNDSYLNSASEVCQANGTTLVTIEHWKKVTAEYGIDKVLAGVYLTEENGPKLSWWPDYGFYALSPERREDVYFGPGMDRFSYNGLSDYAHREGHNWTYQVRCISQ